MNLRLNQRQACYCELSSRLAELSNAEWLQRFKRTKASQGWGLNHHLEIAGHPIFVKRIPLTELEYRQYMSTRNHFRLPLWYNYGVGSAGFGAWRELLAQLKASNWVLSGTCTGFPLLYHHRVLHSHAPWRQWPPEQLKRYTRYWNRSKSVAKYVQERMQAPYEIALFLEFIPQNLFDYLKRPPEHAAQNLTTLIEDAQQTLGFLQAQGILHMDAHFANLLTDGERVYVGDFGLALDRAFELSEAEQRFWEAHRNYDQGEIIGFLGPLLQHYYQQSSSRQRERLQGLLSLPPDANLHFTVAALMSHVDKLQEILSLPSELTQLLRQYREPIEYMTEFYGALRTGAKKALSLTRSNYKSCWIALWPSRIESNFRRRHSKILR